MRRSARWCLSGRRDRDIKHTVLIYLYHTGLIELIGEKILLNKMLIEFLCIFICFTVGFFMNVHCQKWRNKMFSQQIKYFETVLFKYIHVIRCASLHLLWRYINVESSNGSVSLCSKPSPELILTKNTRTLLWRWDIMLALNHRDAHISVNDISPNRRDFQTLLNLITVLREG